MTQDIKLNRRQFLVLSCGALCAAALGSGCTAQQAQSSAVTACPYGEVNDPYPGKCHRYVDTKSNGLCDFSESTEEAALFAPSAPAGSAESGVVEESSVESGSDAAADAAPARAQALCPRGLVDDPYPGRCRRYIDSNNNGYCDLSQVA